MVCLRFFKGIFLLSVNTKSGNVECTFTVSFKTTFMFVMALIFEATEVAFLLGLPGGCLNGLR